MKKTYTKPNVIVETTDIAVVMGSQSEGNIHYGGGNGEAGNEELIPDAKGGVWGFFDGWDEDDD